MTNQKPNGRKGNVVSFVPTGDFYYKRALQAIDADKAEQGYKYMKRAYELKPEDPRILLEFAVFESEFGRLAHAKELLHKAHRLDPGDAETLFLLAEVSVQLGHIFEARKLAQRYLELSGTGEFAEEALEIIDYAESGDLSDLFREMPDGEALYEQEQARVLLESGDFRSAIAALETLVAAHPTFWAAQNNLAIASFCGGDSARAKAILQAMIENGANVHALCNLAVVCFYDEDEEGLAAVLPILNKIQPYSIDHRYKLGSTFALLGHYDKAFHWLYRLFKMQFVGDAGFYYWLSYAAHFSGHRDVAREAWGQLLALDASKEGEEPWADRGAAEQGLERDRTHIFEQLGKEEIAERLYGFYIAGRSPWRENVREALDWRALSEVERLVASHALAGGDGAPPLAKQRSAQRALAVADALYERQQPLSLEGAYMLQMWFFIMESGLSHDYAFRNAPAIAAAVEYMFKTARGGRETKRACAARYGVTPATLAKYVQELTPLLPFSPV